ncbi:MAG TPA: ribosomal protein S18-alanine N-acetyltransferase [Nitrososphaerales archaeon]|nr:ribosomal protein S18-alanine N-acetyltransferase [Nitrososphaerales archaeon]
MQGVRVRRCERRDLPQVLAIEQASFTDPYPRSMFEWLLFRMGGGFFVACRGEVVVGYAVCAVTLRRKGHLVSIAASPGARRSGVGSLLMRSVVSYLEDKGVSEVVLEVRMSNQAAIAFYQKLSFAESGRKPQYYSDGEDAVVMRRRIGLGSSSGVLL